MHGYPASLQRFIGGGCRDADSRCHFEQCLRAASSKRWPGGPKRECAVRIFLDTCGSARSVCNAAHAAKCGRQNSSLEHSGGGNCASCGSPGCASAGTGDFPTQEVAGQFSGYVERYCCCERCCSGTHPCNCKSGFIADSAARLSANEPSGSPGSDGCGAGSRSRGGNGFAPIAGCRSR